VPHGAMYDVKTTANTRTGQVIAVGTLVFLTLSCFLSLNL